MDPRVCERMSWAPGEVNFLPRATEKSTQRLAHVRAGDLLKVGKEGYIHGWICVRPPCGKKYDEVYHPDHGIGEIIDSTGSRARFADGTEGTLGDQLASLPPLAPNAPAGLQRFRDARKSSGDRFVQTPHEAQANLVQGGRLKIFDADYVHDDQENANVYSPEDKKALKVYVGNQAPYINLALRGVTEAYDDKAGKVKPVKMTPSRKSAVSALDEMLKRPETALKRDTVLYRGVVPNVLPSDLKPGDVIHDQGYSSVTGHVPSADYYAHGGAIMRILVPAGSHAVSANAAGVYKNYEQTESIFPRGTSYKVVSIDDNRAFNTYAKNVITAIAIPPAG